MPKLTKFTALLYILFVLQACQSDDVKDTNDIVEDPLMELLSADSTGIYFNNIVKESPTRSHLNFNPIYNGGGVALGDINNDGLLDIYFTGNDVEDKLYLNKGKMQFEDISQNLGALRNVGWHNGATMSRCIE